LTLFCRSTEERAADYQQNINRTGKLQATPAGYYFPIALQ